MDYTPTPQDIEKAVRNYHKRLEYNKAWREAHPAQVKSARQAYNKRKWAKEKIALAQAREEGKL